MSNKYLSEYEKSRLLKDWSKMVTKSLPNILYKRRFTPVKDDCPRWLKRNPMEEPADRDSEG